jgi:hypothetical protein
VGEYTIRSVGEPKPWSNDFGSFLSYPVDLEDVSGHKHIGVEWSRKSDSKPPQVEDRVAGSITPGPYADKFKMDFEATKELKGGGGSSDYRSGGEAKGKGGWKPEAQYDPEKVARIGRAHAQGMAVQAAAAAGYFNGEITTRKLDDDLRPLIDWFEADVNAAANKAASGAGASPPEASAPAQAPHQDIYGLLEKAGVPGPISTLLTSWMIETQSPEKQDEAISALQDDARREKCVAWAEAGYEKAHGPLPTVAKSDNDIPF